MPLLRRQSVGAQTGDLEQLTYVEVQALARAMLACGSYFYCRRLLQMLARDEISVTDALIRLAAMQPRHPPRSA
jgi:hypothetical protein